MTRKERRKIFEVYTRRRVKAASIWLHGFNADAELLNPILVNLRQTREIGLHWLAPNAPQRSISVSQGLHARAWFDIRDERETSPLDRNGMDQSTHLVHELLDRLRTEGRVSQSIIIAGFCQGATLALHAGLRYRHKLAGIVVLSGELPFADSLTEEAELANRKTPILMLHGQHDDIVPIAEARANRDGLLAAGFNVDWREFPIAHAISPEEVEQVDDWMHNRLTRSRPG